MGVILVSVTIVLDSINWTQWGTFLGILFNLLSDSIGNNRVILYITHCDLQSMKVFLSFLFFTTVDIVLFLSLALVLVSWDVLASVFLHRGSFAHLVSGKSKDWQNEHDSGMAKYYTLAFTCTFLLSLITGT